MFLPIFPPLLWQLFADFFTNLFANFFDNVFAVLLDTFAVFSHWLFCCFFHRFFHWLFCQFLLSLCQYFANFGTYYIAYFSQINVLFFFRFLHGFLYWFFTILHHFPPWFLHLLLNWLQHRFSLPISPLISAPNFSTILWFSQIFHIQTSQLICFPN